MSKTKIPVTQAVRLLKAKKVEFKPILYNYVDGGGTKVAAEELGVDEHKVIKTLVMENQDKSPLIILMHGDEEVSTKNLARSIGTKSVTPCNPKAAARHTGYVVGGISPFGTKNPVRIYAEETIFNLEIIYINGGKRGLLVEISPDVLKTVLNAEPVKSAR